MSMLQFTNKNWAQGASTAVRNVFTLFCSGDVIPLEYQCGTIHGIYNQTADGKDIIAIDNDVPHNGDFDKFIKELEKYATRTGERIAICAFMNERLYTHMRKRPGWGILFEFFVKSSTVAEIEKIYQGGKALYDVDNHTLVFDPVFWNPWMCAHECFHILSDIMTVRGLDWIANMNNEHLAYLLQDIYEQVWKETKAEQGRTK